MSRMKVVVLATAILVAVPGLLAVNGQASEEAAVREALQHYLQGHATGDGAHHAMVFHPVSNLYFVRDGQLATRTSEDYIAGAPGEPAADEAQRKRRIVMVDVTGDAAIAKIELDYPNVFFTDYMSLLKIDGEWKIVAKIFHSERGGRGSN